MTQTEKVQFTPGPWRSGDGLCMVFAPDATTIAILANRQETDANARLISAAPDLYAALKRAIQECPCSIKQRNSGHCVSCYAPQALAAIAAAEGK